MYGDFSRLTFASGKHFSAVLRQQGRVELDADANENTAIVLHLMRALARDVIGPHGCPKLGPDGKENPAFLITPFQEKSGPLDLRIGPGRYYVDGILVENDAPATYYMQPSRFWRDDDDPSIKLPSPPFLVYLDVSERHVTAIEDPEIREKALGPNGPDTATRLKVVWQVRAIDRHPDDGKTPITDWNDVAANWDRWVAYWKGKDGKHRGAIKVRAANDPNAGPSGGGDARYRGVENQLYRIEVHAGGTNGGTFKWSDCNGTRAFAIERVAGEQLFVSGPARDPRLALEIDDWVEIVDDASVLSRRPGALRQVRHVERNVITLDAAPEGGVGSERRLHPLVRRWDSPPGSPKRAADDAFPIVPTTDGKDHWIELEDAVQVQFQKGRYETGDYWIVPARTATRNVEWPIDEHGAPEACPPHGTEHFFAPLAFVTGTSQADSKRSLFDYLPR